MLTPSLNLQRAERGVQSDELSEVDTDTMCNRVELAASEVGEGPSLVRTRCSQLAWPLLYKKFADAGFICAGGLVSRLLEVGISARQTRC